MFATSWLVATAAQAAPPPPPPLGSGGSDNASCLWKVTQDGLILDNSSLAVLDIVFSTIGPLYSDDLASDCRSACESSAFVDERHAFTQVKQFRASASKPYCEGIVLVEPPWNTTCNTDFLRRSLPLFRRASVPTCVRLMGSREVLATNTNVLFLASAHLTNTDDLARKIESVSFGMPASCHLKVTSVPLLGCLKGDDLKHTLDEGIDDLNHTDSLNDNLGLANFFDFMFAANATDTGDKQARSQFITWASWILLPLCVLLAAGMVLTYRHYSRRSANLLLSRDRAQLDLQLLSHQVTRVKIGTDDDAPCSLPDSSLPDQEPVALAVRGAPSSTAGLSLPPGPPSSSNAQSVVEQEQAAPRAAAEAGRQGLAEGAGGSQIRQEQTAPLAGEEPRPGLGERAGRSRTKQKQVWVPAPPSWVEAYRKRHAKGAGGSPSKQKIAVPLVWVEADREFFTPAAGKAYLAEGVAASQSKQKQAVHMLQEVPLSWAEADQEFYASAAGKAYLAEGAAASQANKQAGEQEAPIAAEGDQPQLEESVGFGLDSKPTAPMLVYAAVPETRARQDAAAEAMADLAGESRWHHRFLPDVQLPSGS